MKKIGMDLTSFSALGTLFFAGAIAILIYGFHHEPDLSARTPARWIPAAGSSVHGEAWPSSPQYEPETFGATVSRDRLRVE